MSNKYLDEFRNKYPAYKDVDDATLSEGIRKTYYSELSKEDYDKQLSLGNYFTKEEEEKITSTYKDTTPESWTEKISTDLTNVKDGVANLLTSTKASDIAENIKDTNIDNKPKVGLSDILPNKNVEPAYIEKLENQDSSIIDQMQSSISQQANKVARAISKNVNRGLNNETSKEQLLEYAKENNITLDDETINALTSENENYVKAPNEITQKEADWSLGYSAQDRKQDEDNMKDIRKEFDNENYFNAFAKSLKELPSILADSSGEMGMLLSLPSTALAIQTRVSEFEDEYIKNNGKKPDQSWYDTAFGTQALLLLGERFGLGKVGQIALNKAPKKLSTPLVIGGAGAYEGLQERGEYISEEYLTQKENEKSLLDISTSDDANFSQFLGTAAGTGIGAASKGSESILSAINPTEEQKKAKIEDELVNSLNNTPLPKEDILNQVNTNTAYYQNQNNIAVEKKSNIDRTLDGFKQLEEDMKANNDKSVEELLQKDLEVKVSDETTIQETPQENIQALDNNITTNQEVQNQGENFSTQAILKDLNNEQSPQNDESNNKDWAKDIKVSQGSTRANELLLQDLNKNNDEYIYELKEFQGDFGPSYDIDRRLATQEELKQKNKNRLVDTKFQNYFDNGSIDEDGFMTTKSMSKEQFKEFNDYIKEKNIGSYVNKKYSKGGKTGFKIDNQDVINTWFKKDENISPASTTEQQPTLNESSQWHEIYSKFKEQPSYILNGSGNKRYIVEKSPDGIDANNKVVLDNASKKDVIDFYNNISTNKDVLSTPKAKETTNPISESNPVVNENLTNENQVENIAPQIDENSISEERQNQLNELIRFNSLGVDREIKNDYDRELQKTNQSRLDYIKSDDFKKIITDLDSEQEVMFKQAGKKVATRGKLFDLPFGLKGVAVYGNKNDGKIFEYSSGSYLNSWGNGSSNKADLETIIHIRDNLIYRGEDNIKSIMDNAGDKILNPQVVMAKPIPKIGDVKKGQVEFELLLGDDTIEKSFGYPVKLPYNIDGFAHKVKDGWKITEKRSGLQVGFSSTKEKAIQEAKSRIEKQSPERMESSISVAEKRKIKAKYSFDSIESFYDLDNNEKLNVLKEIYKNSNISDNKMQDILDKDWDKDLLGAITETYIDNDFSFNKFKKSDIIKQDNTEVKEDGNINSRTTRSSEESNTENNQSRVSTREQISTDTKRVESSERELSNGQRTDNASNNVSSRDYGISNEDERLGGYRTDENYQPNNKQPIDDNTILSEPANSNTNELNYDLRKKEPIALTRGQRKEANIKVQEIIKKSIEDITPADKEILRLHTGDGGLDEVTEGSFNQHFTNYKTISSIYTALENSGFKFDKVLEPAVGSGNFIGFAPNKTWDIVDIDSTNIEVTKRLYPKVRKIHNETYETFTGKNYDLIISNVPFASAQTLTREYIMSIKPQFKAIHNFYFAHSLDKVKDNGVVAFMTSTSTLDGSTEAKKLREHIITKADIIGAFRLPENSQRENAHTDTMIDIIFLQKRPDGIESRQKDINDSFVKIKDLDGYPINEYLVSQNGILGNLEIGNDRTKMGKVGWIVTGEPKYENIKLNYEPYEIKKEIKYQSEYEYYDSLEDFEKYAKENNIEYKYNRVDNGLEINEKDEVIYYHQKIKIKDDDLKIISGEILSSTNSKKISILNDVMKYAEDYIQTKNQNSKVRALSEIKSYKEIYKKSPHNDTSFKKFMKEHNADKLYKELISYFDKDFKPAAIFEEDVRFEDSGKIEVTNLSSLEDRALSYENADGEIDLSKDYSLLETTEIVKLISENKYAVVGKQKIQNAYMYYAGNVYQKIDDLKSQYAIDNITKEQYDRQLKKLEDIKPKTTSWKDIRFKGNESWFPKQVSDKFLLKKEDEYFAQQGIFSNDSYYEIYANYLNNTQLVSRDQKNETIDEHRVRLLDANKLLQDEILPQIKSFIEKQGDIDLVEEAYNKSSSFYVEPKLTGQLLKDMPKQFRGKPFTMQSHQLQGAELVVYNKKGVIAFAPGGGKTITAIVAVKQLLNQGVMKKPLFVVPVNTIAQWEETVRELYPESKVFEFPKLKSGPNKGQAKEWSQLNKDEKEQIVYDLSNNRYDFTIIGDTAFQKIGLPEDAIDRYATDLVDQITQIENNEEESGNSNRKSKKNEVSIESKKRAFVRGIKEQYSDDITIDIEKLGFDGIIADEVQNYKNIGMQGKDVRGNLGGSITVSYSKNGEELTQKDIAAGAEPDSAKLGSWRAYDFRFKTRYISEKNNGNNVILLTGTPTPNKPLELMTLLHHLDVNILKEYGIDNVSDFTSTFFETADFETTDGQGKPKTEQGLSSIRNTQWLKKIIKRFVNYKGFEDMPDLPRPKQIDVQHFLNLSPAGESIFTDIKDRLIKAIEDSKDRNKSKDDVEQTITMYMAGRDASIDLRLYNVGSKGKSKYTQEEINELIREDSITNLNNKVEKTVQLITEQYKKNKQSGQIVFNDRIKYKDSDGSEKSIHQEIKNKLLESDLFESKEIVIVTGQQYTNPDTGNDYKLGTTIKNTMLQRIMDKYNAGEIKVIIGNTAKLGVGVDLNRHTTDIYQIDIPFRPDWIEQRNNRGVRQGNINKEVRVHSFFQLGTFDQFSFDIVKKKEGFNNIFWKDTDTEYATIDKGEQLDAYEMVIQVEPDVFKREKLRLERILDKGQFELKDIEKKLNKYVTEISTKESLINGETGFKKRIERLEDELKPKNYPKYENIKDEKEKAKKIEEHIKRINERIEKEKSRIEQTNQDIENIKELVELTRQDLANKKAQIEMVTNTYVFNGRVSLDLIKDEYTAEQLLKKEGKSAAQIKEYMKSIDNDNTSYMRTNNEAMPNNPERLTGKQSIRNEDNKMILRDKEIPLPDKYSPMTPAKIRKQIIDIIGNRLYFSKIKQKAEGYYKKKTGETRIKDINNVEVYAHEMAHYLDFYKGNNIFKRAYKDNRFKNEVESFSYTNNEEQKSFEGFAEYVRAWLTQYDFAKQKAPNFTEEFEMILKETGLETKMNQLQEDMHIWYKQGDEAMFSALIGDKKSKLDSLKETIFNIKHSVMNKFIVNIFDRTHGFSIAEFAMFNKLNKAEQSPTKLLRLALGGSSATYEAVIKWGTPKLTANGDLTFSGKGLADIFEPIIKKGSNEFKSLMEYFAAVQANEMQQQGKKTPFSESQIETVLQRGETNPEFKRVFKEYQDFNNRMLDFYVDMDYLTPQDVENFRDKNSVYVPMQRVVESMGQKDGYAGGFFTRKGSDRNIRDIEKNITEQLYHHIKGAMIAHAKSKLFSQLSRHEDGSLFAVGLSTDTKKVKVGIEQQAKKIVEILYSSGMMLDETGSIIEIEDNVSLEDVMDNTIDFLIEKPHLMNFLTFGHKPKNTGSNIEEVIIDGEKKYFEIQNGELGDILNITLNNLGGLQYNWFMSILYAIKNFETRAITAMPQFKLPNFVRDTLDAQVFRKTKKPLNPLAGAKSYFTIDDAFKNYMLNGGGYGTILEGAYPSSPQDIFKESKLQKLDRFMSFDEYSNRVKVAQNAIEEGNNWFEAAFQGRDLTVDFSMVGANKILRGILKLIPFQQAAMNGMYKLIREIKDEGHNPTTYAKAVARLSIKGFTYLTSIAIVSFLMNEDDERYKALTSDELARFVWFFYDKNEQPIKIPVPFGLGAIFQKFPEYLMSSLFSDGDFIDNRYSEAVKFAFVNQLLAVPNAGIFETILQDLINKKFTGAPIVSPELKKVESYLQYTNNTPLFYKELGSATGLSPVRLEHYTKGTIKYIESPITGMIQMALWDKDKWGEMPYSSTGDYIHSTFFKQFYKMNETSRSAWSEEYYKYRQKIDEAYNSLMFSNKQIIKDRGAEYEKYLSKKDKVTLTGLKELTISLDEINAELASAETAITFNKDLTAKEKEKQLEDIYKGKTKLFKEVYKQINLKIKEVK